MLGGSGRTDGLSRTDREKTSGPCEHSQTFRSPRGLRKVWCSRGPLASLSSPGRRHGFVANGHIWDNSPSEFCREAAGQTRVDEEKYRLHLGCAFVAAGMQTGLWESASQLPRKHTEGVDETASRRHAFCLGETQRRLSELGTLHERSGQ